MNKIATANTAHPIPAFFTQGFRPFFFAAALWSAVALALWIVMFATGTPLPSRFDPLAWHIHEMLFGFVMAAIAGFFLTAMPNWTGRAPIRGGLLALLAGLWLLGRLVCLVSAFIPFWIVVAADLSFSIALLGVVARELVIARNRRNMPMIAVVTILVIANLLMHLQSAGVAVPAGLGWRLALAAIVVLISVIGGRIVPNFTRNWLAKRSEPALPPEHDRIDRFALGLLHAGIMAWVFLPSSNLVGLLLLGGAAVNFWRVLRWRGAATAEEPLLLILHIGYLWLVLAIALLGVSMIDADLPRSAAIHALTTGTIGTTILAVMTRATRGHSGRVLSADRLTTLIYILVTLAAMTRVAAAFATIWTMPILIASGCLWIAAFGCFLVGYGPMLLF